MFCARHPKVETNLRCGKCGDYICLKCTVQTPVGARCPTCAKVTRLPVFQVSKIGYLKALVAGFLCAVVFGIVWGLIAPSLLGYGYLLVLLAAYVISELINRVVNRKRSNGLQIVAGGCTIASYVVAINLGLHVSLFSLIAVAIGVVIAVSRFRKGP